MDITNYSPKMSLGDTKQRYGNGPRTAKSQRDNMISIKNKKGII